MSKGQTVTFQGKPAFVVAQLERGGYQLKTLDGKRVRAQAHEIR